MADRRTPRPVKLPPMVRAEPRSHVLVARGGRPFNWEREAPELRRRHVVTPIC